MKRKRTRSEPDAGGREPDAGGREPDAGARKRDAGVPGGGAGRKEAVRGSGVYPPSGVAAPQDAVVRTAGEWGKGAGGQEGGQSELHFTEEELKRAREADQPPAGKKRKS